jgi:hypothetical protein
MKKSGLKVKQYTKKSPVKSVKKSSKKINHKKKQSLKNILQDGFEIYHDPPSSPRKKSVKKTKKKRQPLKNITNTLRNDGKKRRSKSPLKLRK